MCPTIDRPATQGPVQISLSQAAFRKSLQVLSATVSRLAVIAALAVCLQSSATAQGTPADFESTSAAAIAAQQQNDIPRAIDLFRQSVQQNPRWPQGWFSLGMLLYSTSDYANARDALGHYIEMTPDAGAAMAVRGLCEFETGEYPQSLYDLQRGLALGAANQPRNSGILWYHEILLLNRAGKFEDALAVATNFAPRPKTGLEPNRDPDSRVSPEITPAVSPEIILAIGMAGLRVSSLPTEILLSAEQRDLYMQAGSAALSLLAGDSERGQQAFQAIFQQFPTAANTHFLLGYLVFSKDQDQAAAEFARELEISPDNVAAETMLGWASLMRQDYPSARKYGEKAVALAPQLTVPQLVLGRSLVETGEIDRGLDHLQIALGNEPDNIEIHIALVRAYSKSGRTEDAQRERLKCLTLTGAVENSVAQP